MRAAELNERNNPSTVLYYAPRRRIADDGASIVPLLERLSRGEQRARLVEAVPLAPAEEPIGAPEVANARARALAIAVRSAAVTGVGVGLAAVLAFMWHDLPREDRAPLAAVAPAKSVQTVSYKSQDRLGSNVAPLPAPQMQGGEPLRAAALAVADGTQAASDAALPPAVSAYAMVPPALPPAHWGAADETAREPVVPAVAPEAAEPPAAAAAVPPAAEARQHHARSHRHRHAAAAQTEQPAAAQEEKSEAVPPPVDNSLRAVLDKMFRPD